MNNTNTKKTNNIQKINKINKLNKLNKLNKIAKTRIFSTQNILLLFVLALVVCSIIYLESIKPKISGQHPKTSDQSGQQSQYTKAPEFQGITGWINSPPLTMEQLRGKVVIVDFWTYSCVNCLRTLPYLNAWYDKYHDKGLVIIGVHTPEFNFEKNYDNVALATKMYGVKYPVALDSNYGTWNAYGNQYWPRKYLVDANGNIRFDHIGEGNDDQVEKEIQQLLAEAGSNMTDDSGVVNVTDQTPTTRNTPEIYAGYQFAIPRGEDIGNDGGLKPDTDNNYLIKNIGTIDQNRVYLEGQWFSAPEAIKKSGNLESSVYLKFVAKSANIVAESITSTSNITSNISSNLSNTPSTNSLANSSKLYVYIDGKYISKDVAGSDVQYDGDVAFIQIKEPRLYNIYTGPYAIHTLKLSTSNNNFEFNSFTFG